MEQVKHHRGAFYILISVFFFWGFVAASNTVLIPVFKSKFNLEQWQSQLVEFAFYIAYFVGSLVYFIWSSRKGDPLNRYGYKKGLTLGLLMSAAGTLLFIPASISASFGLFLLGYFIIAFGFSLQQIVANPYVIAMGDPSTGAHRVSLAGGINSFGTTVGPLLIASALFGSVNSNVDANTMELTQVQTPYLILGLAFVLFALFIWFSKLPSVKNDKTISRGNQVFKFPQLVLGMIAIFVYVGVEVSVQSNLPALMQDSNFLGLNSKDSVHFISLYWGCLMMGRWAGASSAFGLKKKWSLTLNALMPIVAFAVVCLVNYIKSSPMQDLYNFWPFVVISMIAFVLANEKPAFTMMLFGGLAALLIVAGIFTTGIVAVYCLIATGLFCSVMWPCIFSLSIAGLKEYTNQGSSLLIMMIVGGAAFPIIQGALADQFGIQNSYWLPFIGFIYLAYFGYAVKKALQKQNFDFDLANSKSN